MYLDFFHKWLIIDCNGCNFGSGVEGGGGGGWGLNDFTICMALHQSYTILQWYMFL